MPRVAISTSSFGRESSRPIDELRDAGFDIRLNPFGRKLSENEALELLHEVDALIAGTEPLNRTVLAQADRLRVISRCGSGLENVDLEAAQEFNIEVFRTPDAHVDAVAELTLCSMLNLLRRVGQADRSLRLGRWQKPMGSLLRGKSIGFVGFGRVSKALADLLQPFSPVLLAFDLAPDQTAAEKGRVRFVEFEELLAVADIVTLHLPLSDTTRGLIDTKRIGMMKSNAFLLNASRGGIVDEAALYDALRQGRLQGAYLDTFEEEPYNGPLTQLDNVLLTPHIGSYARECRVRMEQEAANNILRFFRTLK